MKKLFIFSALITLALGGSCSDSETDEFQNILIPQDNLSASISADVLSHTIGFETTQSWTASVRETSRAESLDLHQPHFGRRRQAHDYRHAH